MANPRPRLLFVTRTSPFAGESGSGTYVFDLLEYLAAQGFQIRVLWTEPPDLLPSRGWYTPPPASRHAFSLEVMDMVKIGTRFWRPSVVWLPIKAHTFHFIKTALRRIGLWRREKTAAQRAAEHAQAAAAAPAWGAAGTPAEIAATRAAIARWQPDVVMANYAWMAPAIRETGTTSPRFAVLTHDVRHRQLHLRDGELLEKLDEHMTLAEELHLLSPADALIAIQEPEAQIFSRLFPDKTIVTAPMSPKFVSLSAGTKSHLLFVGSGHGPNRAGLFWFIEHVWPEIRREIPTVRLLIAGSVCNALPENLPPGIMKLGRLPDLAAAYARATVVIAPIFQGSGIKIKILEAIGFGRACVTTSVGAEGFEALRDELCVADTAPAFAQAAIQLLRDPAAAAQSGAALQEKARVCLSREACYGPVAGLLRTLASETPPHS